MTLNGIELVLRNVVIATDGEGRVCLDDLWKVSRAKEGKQPKRWRQTRAYRTLKSVLQEKVGDPDLFGNVVHSARGRGNKGTYAHPILAAAYAGYLDPNLEIEMREVWLRYRAGDADLADDILERASAEENRRVGVRAMSRAQRNAYTDVLKEHGVEGRGYMECTEALYIHLLGGRSYEIRARMSLKPKANIREHLDASKLSFVMAAEALAAERIAEESRKGNSDCANATAISASAISQAVNDDRKNRQARFVA